MLVDSHCHLDFPELAGQLDEVFALMRANQVDRALCVSVTLDDFPRVRQMAQDYAHIYASVGVHPDYETVASVSAEELVALADHLKVVAIGETGLDYYRLKGDLEWQRDRFRSHIRGSARVRQTVDHSYAFSRRRHPACHAGRRRGAGGRGNALLHRKLGDGSGSDRDGVFHLLFRYRDF